VWVGKIALFVKASVAALACGALAMCAMWVGVSIVFLRVGEKNKINSLKFALTYQRAKSILISILSLSYQVVVVFLHLPLTD